MVDLPNCVERKHEMVVNGNGEVTTLQCLNCTMMINVDHWRCWFSFNGVEYNTVDEIKEMEVLD